MKIYFAGSIRAGRGDQDVYAQIIAEYHELAEAEAAIADFFGKIRAGL